MTPDKGKEDHTTPTKGKASKDKSGGKDTAKGERKKSAERKSTSKTEKRRPSVNVQSPPPGAVTPVSDGDNIRYDFVCLLCILGVLICTSVIQYNLIQDFGLGIFTRFGAGK